MTALSIKRRRFFDCKPSTDGCDETYEVVSRQTGQRIAWAGYWEANKPARRSALLLTKALNSVFAGYGINFCISSLANEQRQLAIIWNIDDVLELCPDLTQDQAWHVLQVIDWNHDANIGVNWEVIAATAEDLFAEPSE